MKFWSVLAMSTLAIAGQSFAGQLSGNWFNSNLGLYQTIESDSEDEQLSINWSQGGTSSWGTVTQQNLVNWVGPVYISTRGCTAELYTRYFLVDKDHLIVNISGSNGACGFQRIFTSSYDLYREQR